MTKLYRIKRNDLFLSSVSAVPSWTKTGAYLTELQVEAFLRLFKYQRSLLPDGIEILSCTVGPELPDDILDTFMEKINEEVTYESLKGSAW